MTCRPHGLATVVPGAEYGFTFSGGLRCWPVKLTGSLVLLTLETAGGGVPSGSSDGNGWRSCGVGFWFIGVGAACWLCVCRAAKTGTGENGAFNDLVVAYPPRRRPVFFAVYMSESKLGEKDLAAAQAEIGALLAKLFAQTKA